MSVVSENWKSLVAPVRELLWRDWKPLPAAAEDEYDTYIMQVVGKIMNGASAIDVAAYLDRTDEELMGQANGRPVDHSALAAKLVALREAK